MGATIRFLHLQFCSVELHNNYVFVDKIKQLRLNYRGREEKKTWTQIQNFEKSVALCWVLHVDGCDSGHETALEKAVGVWLLVVTIQLPSNKVFPEALWASRGTAVAGSGALLTDDGVWKKNKKKTKLEPGFSMKDILLLLQQIYQRNLTCLSLNGLLWGKAQFIKRTRNGSNPVALVLTHIRSSCASQNIFLNPNWDQDNILHPRQRQQ